MRHRRLLGSASAWCVDGVTGPGPRSRPAALATALLDGALRAAGLEGGRSSLTLMVLRSQRDEPRSKHQGETTMEQYAGIDVSLECSSVCVVDAKGKIVREAKVASEPQALIDWLGSLGFGLERIGLEGGPLSQWLFAGMKKAGLAVELLETRHVRKAFEAMPVKSDRNDARGIAQLMRLGWFRPVHCKSMSAQETRTLLTARKLVQSKLHDVENSLRGILRGFGLKVGKTTELKFAGRIEELVAGHPHLQVVTKALLAVRAVLRSGFAGLQQETRKRAQSDAQTRLLMSTPAVGPIVALTYASAIDDPARF